MKPYYRIVRETIPQDDYHSKEVYFLERVWRDSVRLDDVFNGTRRDCVAHLRKLIEKEKQEPSP